MRHSVQGNSGLLVSRNPVYLLRSHRSPLWPVLVNAGDSGEGELSFLKGSRSALNRTRQKRIRLCIPARRLKPLPER
jgi:hypothetical protein